MKNQMKRLQLSRMTIKSLSQVAGGKLSAFCTDNCPVTNTDTCQTQTICGQYCVWNPPSGVCTGVGTG